MGRPGGFSAQREGSHRAKLLSSVIPRFVTLDASPPLQGAPNHSSHRCRSLGPARCVFGAALRRQITSRGANELSTRTLVGAIPSRGFAQINASAGLRRARRPAALRRAAKEWPRARKLVPLCGSSCGARAVERVAGSFAHKKTTRASLIPSPSRRGRCLRACAVPQLSLREQTVSTPPRATLARPKFVSGGASVAAGLARAAARRKNCACSARRAGGGARGTGRRPQCGRACRSPSRDRRT